MLTQLFLSQMLGVRRATVSEVAAKMQSAGLIEYARGQITVRDRGSLEAASCVCYTIIRNEFAPMLDGKQPADPLDRLQLSAEGKSIVGDGTPHGDNT
jgi:hypothetical protein